MVRLGVKRSLIYNGFFDLVAIPPRPTNHIGFSPPGVLKRREEPVLFFQLFPADDVQSASLLRSLDERGADGKFLR